MHQEDFYRRSIPAISLEQFCDRGWNFARGLQDDGSAVHVEWRVELKAQILSECAVGMERRIQDLHRAVFGADDTRTRAIAK